jgi:heme/copper-type cytochrome/quinol oxidase subunit 2
MASHQVLLRAQQAKRSVFELLVFTLFFILAIAGVVLFFTVIMAISWQNDRFAASETRRFPALNSSHVIGGHTSKRVYTSFACWL